MSESTRDIKRRIQSVKSTQKITRAMEMVAAAKLRRVQEQVIAARPYADKIEEVLRRLSAGATGVDHPLLSTHGEGKIGCVVISGDRGLAGGYNINILRLAQDYVDAEKDETGLFLLGKKGRDYFRYRDYPIMKNYTDLGDTPTFMQARELAKELRRMYKSKEFKEVHLFFTRFHSPIQQTATSFRLLPIQMDDSEDGEDYDREYIFEPSSSAVMGDLLPKYVEVQVFRALLESKTSEHGSRMTAMNNATDNAEEVIDELTLTYNRARQAAITEEISEIVGGAEAQKG